jgi:hypothetical protein
MASLPLLNHSAPQIDPLRFGSNEGWFRHDPRANDQMCCEGQRPLYPEHGNSRGVRSLQCHGVDSKSVATAAGRGTPRAVRETSMQTAPAPGCPLHLHGGL